jgi:hypothetical protein
LPRSYSGGGGGGVSTKGKHFVVESSHSHELRELEDDEDIVYYTDDMLKSYTRVRVYTWHTGNNYPSYRELDKESLVTHTANKLAQHDKILVRVYGNRLEKFKRDFPEAEALDSDKLTESSLNRVISRITDNHIRAYVFDSLNNLTHHTSITALQYIDEVVAGARNTLFPTEDGRPDKIVEFSNAYDKVGGPCVGYMFRHIMSTFFDISDDLKKKRDEFTTELSDLVNDVVYTYPIVKTGFSRLDSDDAMRYTRFDYERNNK